MTKVLTDLDFPFDAFVGDATASALRDAQEKSNGILVTMVDEYVGCLTTLKIGDTVRVINKYRGVASDATSPSSLDFCRLKITQDRLTDGPTDRRTQPFIVKCSRI